jgi:hypothetical protein
MAQKRGTKKPVKKTPEKTAKKTTKQGEGYQCTVCGLAITIDEVCGCMDACDIICCEKQMKPKKKK